MVRRLMEAGAILVGKTNMTEFALSGYHPDLAVPVNPWHSDHWSGMSSSELVPFAVHRVSNPLIEIDGDQATGQWYLWQPTVFRGEALWLSAFYRDRYVRVQGRWLFQHLRLDIRMLTPYAEGPAKTRIIAVDL